MIEIIGFDLDGVLGDFTSSALAYINEKKGASYKNHDVTDFHFIELFGLTKEEFEPFYSSHHFKSMRPLAGAQEALSRLYKRDLFVVTSRPSYLKIQTSEWLERHFKNQFHAVYFTPKIPGQKLKKSVNCKELGLDMLVEDNLEFSLECAETGTSVLLLDHPWNQSSLLPKNVKRVYSWQEILRELA